MNRQPVPSILVSVAIVCFFAVTLYQRDGESRRSPKPGGEAGVVASGTGTARGSEVAEDGGSHPMRPGDRVASTPTTTAKAVDSPAWGANREAVALAPGPPIRAVSDRRASAEPSQASSPSERVHASGWKTVPPISPTSSATGRSGNR
jgi:hypothetical protein